MAAATNFFAHRAYLPRCLPRIAHRFCHTYCYGIKRAVRLRALPRASAAIPVARHLLYRLLPWHACRAACRAKRCRCAGICNDNGGTRHGGMVWYRRGRRREEDSHLISIRSSCFYTLLHTPFFHTPHSWLLFRWTGGLSRATIPLLFLPVLYCLACLLPRTAFSFYATHAINICLLPACICQFKFPLSRLCFIKHTTHTTHYTHTLGWDIRHISHTHFLVHTQLHHTHIVEAM